MVYKDNSSTNFQGVVTRSKGVNHSTTLTVTSSLSHISTELLPSGDNYPSSRGLAYVSKTLGLPDYKMSIPFFSLFQCSVECIVRTGSNKSQNL